MATQTGMQPDDPQTAALFADPENQQKVAGNILMQLGLHPDQAGTKALLDQHLVGPTAHPDVKSLIQPIAPEPTQPLQEKLPSVPGPGSLDMGPTFAASPKINTSGQTMQDQDELHRLITTGSGISQIHNPFLRTLAHVGEAAETGMFPAFAEATPGTLIHHNILLSNQEKMVNSDVANSEREAATQHSEAQAADLENKPDKDPTELDVWLKQNPNQPISEYWKQKAAVGGGKLTPDEQVLRSLTTSVDEGGQGLSVEDAYKKVLEMKAENKPNTASQTEQELEGLMAKVFPNGQMDPKIMSDPLTLGKAISQSDQLTPEQKSQLLAHFVFKASPASQGGIASTRADAILRSRQTPTIDTTTGKLGLTNSAQLNADPNRYIPAGPGQQAMTREALFQDIGFNLASTRQAFNDLQHGFTIEQRAQLALALRQPNAHSAMDAVFHSSIASQLTPDQVDLVTALASLNENAMVMRGIQGVGQSSDQVRSAIMQLIPGAGTPDKDYAKRQMDLLEGTINRLNQGVAKTGIKHPALAPAPKTGEKGGTFKFTTPGPNPKTYTFTTQQQLDDFKREAGVQ